MSVEIIPSRNFQKEAKRLLKKYPSLKDELKELNRTLTISPTFGTSIGFDCYKIRLAIKSKGKGKSGGARVVTHVVVRLRMADPIAQRVYLLSIYDKSEFESISDQDLRKLIQEIKDN